MLQWKRADGRWGFSPGKPRQSKAAPERGGGEKLLECKSLQF